MTAIAKGLAAILVGLALALAARSVGLAVAVGLGAGVAGLGVAFVAGWPPLRAGVGALGAAGAAIALDYVVAHVFGAAYTEVTALRGTAAYPAAVVLPVALLSAWDARRAP